MYNTIYIYFPVETDEIPGRHMAQHPIPYMAALKFKGGPVFCGGVIIDEFWVATAAHCVVDIVIHEDGSEVIYYKTRPFYVVVGTMTLHGGTPYLVKNVIYNKAVSEKKGFTNDFAVLRIGRRAGYRGFSNKVISVIGKPSSIKHAFVPIEGITFTKSVHPIVIKEKAIEANKRVYMSKFSCYVSKS